MPKFFATATISTEFEVEAATYHEAVAHFRRTLGIDVERPELELTARDANTGPLLLIDPMVSLGLIGEVVGPLG
jgi:hypothetical protein